MKTMNILGMTAAVALLSAPAMASEKYWIDTDGDGYAETSIENQLVGGTAFGKLDKNKDGVISRKEFQSGTLLDETNENFALYDTDQSNTITAEELATNSKFGNAVLTNKTSSKSNLKTSSGQEIGSMDAKFFNDATEANDYAYWPQGLTLDAKRVQQGKSLFEQLDDNANGKISFKEFQANTVRGNDYSAFKKFDKNKDDKITKAEFNKYDRISG